MTDPVPLTAEELRRRMLVSESFIDTDGIRSVRYRELTDEEWATLDRDRSTPSVHCPCPEHLLASLTDGCPCADPDHPAHTRSTPSVDAAMPRDESERATADARVLDFVQSGRSGETLTNDAFYGRSTPSVDELREALASKRGDYDDSEFGGMWRPNPEGGVVNWDDVEAALAATTTPTPLGEEHCCNDPDHMSPAYLAAVEASGR